MKLKNILLPTFALTVLSLVIGCKKEFPNVFNMFNAKLTLHKSEPYAVGEELKKEISATDSVLLDYTIESPDADMYQVALYKTGASSPALKVPVTDASQRRTFSGKFKLYARDLGPGSTSYRIWAYDKDGVYLGDGGKLITITVTPDLLFFTNRRIYVADSVDKIDECYLSISDGKLYSYTTGASHSATIDLGSFVRRDTIRNASGVVTSTTLNHYFYSLSADPLPFRHYDISTWTKRATLFSAPTAGSIAELNNNLNTGAKILAAAKTKTINLKNIPTALVASQLIYFKTPEEKYGVIFVHTIATDFSNRRYTQVSYKIAN